MARDKETQQVSLVKAEAVSRPSDGARRTSNMEQSRQSGKTQQPLGSSRLDLFLGGQRVLGPSAGVQWSWLIAKTKY